MKLELQDIEVEFRRGQPVLKEVQLSIPSGCRLALLGSNGSGKSTLLHCLLGLIRPNQGRILVDGTDLAYDRRSLSLHRQKLGLLLQDPDDQLMAVTVEDDVALGPRNLGLSAVETEERVASACSQVGLDALRTSPIQGLSTGLKKRIALAGLLAMRPKVLILDEPTAGLDHQGCSSLLALLLELEQQGVSLIIATHDLDLVARWADQVAVLQDGKIGILDTPLNVFQRSGSLSGLPLITEVSRSLVPNHPEFIRDAQQLLALLQPSSQCKAKNIHLGQILICRGCCCGNVKKENPEVPWNWLAKLWNESGLNAHIQLSLTGCLGPCERANVVAIQHPNRQHWFGGLETRDDYQQLLIIGKDWLESKAFPEIPAQLAEKEFQRWNFP